VLQWKSLDKDAFDSSIVQLNLERLKTNSLKWIEIDNVNQRASFLEARQPSYESMWIK
jgi:hypothetical protein